jgi:hypothetical protein
MCGRFSEKEWVFLDFPYQTMYTATNLSNSFKLYASDFVGFFQNYPHPFWGGGGGNMRHFLKIGKF